MHTVSSRTDDAGQLKSEEVGGSTQSPVATEASRMPGSGMRAHLEEAEVGIVMKRVVSHVVLGCGRRGLCCAGGRYDTLRRVREAHVRRACIDKVTIYS